MIPLGDGPDGYSGARRGVGLTWVPVHFASSATDPEFSTSRLVLGKTGCEDRKPWGSRRQREACPGIFLAMWKVPELGRCQWSGSVGLPSMGVVVGGQRWRR